MVRHPAVTIHDTNTGETLAALGDHDLMIEHVTFSPDGTTLAAAGALVRPDERSLFMWDVRTGASLVDGTPTLSTVADVAYSPDGRRLATIEEDGTLRLWNAANGVEQWAMQRWEEAYSVAFSHDGKFVAGSGARFPPDASYEVDQAVFDVDTGEVVGTLVGHED